MQDEDDGPTCQSHGPDMLHLLMQQPSQFFCPLICNLTKHSFFFEIRFHPSTSPHPNIYYCSPYLYYKGAKELENTSHPRIFYPPLISSLRCVLNLHLIINLAKPCDELKLYDSNLFLSHLFFRLISGLRYMI
jgi:hypothetical protein